MALGRGLWEVARECSISSADSGLFSEIRSECRIFVKFVSISDIESAEIGKSCSDRTSVWWETRALSGGSVKIFCSMAEHVDWPAEQISSMCGICIGFWLCSADQAELGLGAVDEPDSVVLGRGL